ncbi:MAG: GAF domain-containing protein, partial [Anaerolineae bacterium]
QRVAELEAIRQASLSLTSSLRLPQVLESILQTTLDLLPVAKNTHIFLHEDGKLRFGAARWADGRTGTPWATPRSHGLTHTVARSGDLLVVPDMQAHPLFEDAPAEWQGAIIGLPLKISQRVVGVMSIAYQEGHAISEAELRALGLLADQAALAVENARLFAAERQTRLELQSIQTTATALGTELDLETLPGKIVEEAARAFRAEAASVMLWDEREQSLTIRAGTGLSQAYLDQQRIARERAYQVIGDGSGTVEPFYIENLLERPLGIGELIEQEGLVSVLIIPLLLQGEFIGTLNIYSRGERRHFTPGEIDLAQTFAGHAAVAIENARLLAAEARRRREAETLQTATQALAATRDLQQVLQVILTELRQVVPYDSATVQRLEDGLLEIIGGAGFPNIDDLLGVLFDVTASDNPNRQVVESRAPVILHDAPAVYGRFEQEPHAQASIRSWLGVPLLFGDRLIGMLALDKQEPGFYNAEHARLVMAFAAQAAIATENVRLYQETRQRLKELALLFDTSADLSTTLDVDRVALLTARHITAALNVRGCTISLWYAKEHEMVTLLDYSPNMEGWKDKEPGTVYDLDQYPESYRVLNERCPIVVLAGDPDADPAELAWMQDSDVKSVLMVPMVVRDKAIGLLELIESDREREFTETDISLSQTLANQAAAALDNARLFHETEMRAQEMAALAAVGQALRSLELDEILDLVAENALQAARAEISSVYLLDEEKQVLVPRSVRGIQKEELEQASFHLGEGTIGQVAESGESLIVQDISQSLTFAVKTNAARQIRNTLTVPLAAKERVIGTLEVCNKVNGGKFTEDDRRLLDAFAAQAAAAIENARLYQELSHHLEDVQILNKVANAVTSTLDFDMMLRRGMQALIGTRNFERVNILLLDEEKNDLWLHPALTVNWTFPPRADIRIPLGTGISGRVAESGQPIRVADVRIEPNYVAGYADTMSEICVPLRVGNRVIGVLDVQSRCVGAFSADDERLLTTVAGQFSTVIENSRLFAETRQRVRELTALMQASRALNEAQDLDTILDIVLEEAFSLIGSHEGSVILIDPPGSNQLRIVAERGLGQAVIDSFNERPVHTHEGTYRRALETGKLIEVHDTSADADFLTDVGSQAKSVTNIPLLIDRGPIGLIAVDGVPGDDTTRRLLTALAGMAAVAIDKERLHQETAHRLSEVSTLYTLSTQITTSLVLGPVLDSIVAILRMTLDCRSCSIFLLDQAGEYLRLEAGSGPSASWRGIARMRLGEGISGRVVAERRSIYVPDTRAESDFLFFDPQIRSLLVVPLIVRNQVIGTLSIDDTQAHAFDDEMRLLTIAAAQAAVAIENAQLYESLQESYSELEQAYDELRELDKMKSELIQNISHELRTPLTFIKGYVELLLDGEMGPVDEEQRMALEIVDNKSEVLSNLVDDIISMQQASREQLQLQPLSLAELAQTEIRSAHPSAQEAGVALKQEIPETVPDVLADRRRMGQVFDNLLQNAIKFSNP